jgi:hypothetical protein
MRFVIAMSVVASACSSQTKEEKRLDTCKAADAPTLSHVARRCGTIYIETPGGCKAVPIEGTERMISLMFDYTHAGQSFRMRRSFSIEAPRAVTALRGGTTQEYRREPDGRWTYVEPDAATSCVPVWEVTMLEAGVFEIRLVPGSLDEPSVDYWHVDKTRCERARIERTRPKNLIAGLGGCG